MLVMTIDDRGSRIAHAIALLVFAVMLALPCAAQEKFRFPIGEENGVRELFHHNCIWLLDWLS